MNDSVGTVGRGETRVNYADAFWPSRVDQSLRTSSGLSAYTNRLFALDPPGLQRAHLLSGGIGR
jgi:hypothetical protein